MTAPTRRGALLAGIGLAGCATRPPPVPRWSGPPSYRHLIPLRFAVGSIEIVEAPAGAAMLIMPPAPIAPAEILGIMARDRLAASGGPGVARFVVMTASLTRQMTSGGGMFSQPSEQLVCEMRCRLEISGAALGEGYAEAAVRSTALRPATSPEQRAINAEEIVRRAGDDMNVEFEFQVRRNLRPFLQATAAPGEAVPAPVQQETLPRE